MTPIRKKRLISAVIQLIIALLIIAGSIYLIEESRPAILRILENWEVKE